MIIEGESARKICDYFYIEQNPEVQVRFSECNEAPGFARGDRRHLLSVTRPNPDTGTEVYYFQKPEGPATIVLKHDEGNTVITLDGRADVEMVTKIWKRQADGALRLKKTVDRHPTTSMNVQIIDDWFTRTDEALQEARRYNEERNKSSNLYALLGLGS